MSQRVVKTMTYLGYCEPNFAFQSRHCLSVDLSTEGRIALQAILKSSRVIGRTESGVMVARCLLEISRTGRMAASEQREARSLPL